LTQSIITFRLVPHESDTLYIYIYIYIYIAKSSPATIYLFMFNLKALRTLMTSVMTDWINSTNSPERKMMLRLARRGRSLSSRYYALATMGVSFYMCLNLLKFYRNIHHSQRRLVYHFVYPYNSQKSPNYEITFVIQLCGGLCTGLINCTVDSFISILLLHVCAQLINLRTALNNLVDELANKSISSSKFKEGLAAIAVRHKHLIRYGILYGFKKFPAII